MNITDYGEPWTKERIPLVRGLVRYARHLLPSYEIGRPLTNPVRRAIEMAESWLSHGTSGPALPTHGEMRIATADAAVAPEEHTIGIKVTRVAALALGAIYSSNQDLAFSDPLYQIVIAAHRNGALEADDVKPEAAKPPSSHLDDLRARLTALVGEVSGHVDKLEDLLSDVEEAKGAYEETRENLRAALDSLTVLP